MKERGAKGRKEACHHWFNGPQSPSEIPILMVSGYLEAPAVSREVTSFPQSLTPDLEDEALETPAITLSLIVPLLLRTVRVTEKKVWQRTCLEFSFNVMNITPDCLSAPGTQVSKRQEAHPMGREKLV